MSEMKDPLPKEDNENLEDPKKAEAKEKIDIEKEEYERLKAEIKEHKDKYLRLLAESENARKRLQKEKGELQAYARENLICDFLTPIDHFENALNFREGISEDVKNWMVGFEMILAQFKDILAQNDIRPIESMGKTFDPYYHEALDTEENEEHPINTIIQEYVRGYQMGSKVIRPSKVKVVKPKATKQAQEEDKKSTETINQKEG